MFEFYVSTKVYFGKGSRLQLFKILADNSWNRIGFVVDKNVSETTPVTDLIKNAKDKCEKVIVDYCTVSEPSYDFLDTLRKSFHDQGLQVIIGVGGGSSLDAAKAMAVLVNNRESAITYRGFDMMTEPVLPVIAIPTTAGTGSEVTPNASFIDTKGKRKMGINGEAIRPKYAILDPEFTLSCPLNPTISVAVDSIVHATESYVAKKTSPLARLFASEGIKHVFHYLPLVVKDMNNIEYREKVMYGAFLAGVALMNSGTGPAAAMSYPLGVHYKVPHGIGGGIFLPHVISYNISNGFYDYAGLYDSIKDDVCSDKMSMMDKSNLFLENMLALWKILSVPDDLPRLGLNINFVPQFIRETMDLKGALDQNPIAFGEESIIYVLNKLNVK
jgi:alcohol dehydrogenase class IV